MLQMRKAATNLRPWMTALVLKAPSEHFVSLATPPYASQSDRAMGCGTAALRPAPHQHVVRQVLVACTNRRILVLHTTDASRILLSCTLPACIIQACSLSVRLWQHAPARRSDSFQLSPIKRSNPMSASASRATVTEHTPPSSSHAWQAPDGLHIGSAPLCLGFVFVSCRTSGLTAVQPLALLPAAHGLTVNRTDPMA